MRVDRNTCGIEMISMARRADNAKIRSQLSERSNRAIRGAKGMRITSRRMPQRSLLEADDLVERISSRREGAFLSDSVDDLAAIRQGER
jgi:hypothetical protein